MKKKLIISMLCVVLSLTTVACGSATTTTSTSGSTIEELEARIEELEEENEELKNQLAELNVEEDKQEAGNGDTWADDYIIPFSNVNLKKMTIEITGITERDITYGDVKGITKFGDDSRYSEISSLDSLKYFTSLREIYLRGQCSFYTLQGLENLDNLVVVRIESSNLEDISALANKQNLEDINIVGTHKMDASVLDTCSNLEGVEINKDGNRIHIHIPEATATYNPERDGGIDTATAE